MRKTGTIALAAAGLFALLAAGWWFGSPWWTLWRMREAAAAGDSGTLASYIDFPALRASTRAQLRPRRGDPNVADLEVIRTGASEFRLHRKGGTGDQGDLVFRRHGLGWKLAEVRIVRD